VLSRVPVVWEDDGDESGDEARRVDGGVLGDVLVVVGGAIVVRRVVVKSENVGRCDVVVDGLVTGGLRRVVRMFEIVTSLSLIKLELRSNHSSKRLVYFPVGSYFSAKAVKYIFP
jgi:hypothetical protein